MTAAEDDWWIFGSAAAALHGVEVDGVKDIDLLVSRAAANRLMAAAIDFDPMWCCARLSAQYPSNSQPISGSGIPVSGMRWR
jgi:hypothetical protein